MAGSRDIKAGKAAIEIVAETDPLKRSLAKGSAMLRGWGSNLTGISSMANGLWASIAGSAAVAAFGSTIKAFADIGSAINDMSGRTGLAADRLQHLSFAARQSGASIQDVELALKNMARKGLSVADFEKMGQGMSAISDESERAEKFLDVFGKAGTRLIPMFRDWNSLKASSLALGPILSGEEVKMADALGDAIGALSEAFSRLKQRIGSLSSTNAILATMIGLVVELNENLSGKVDAKSTGNPFTDIAEMFKRVAAKGRAAMASFETTQSEEALETSEKTAMTWDKITKSIISAHEKRNALIREFDTPAERFLSKQKEIFTALAQVQRNRALGFVNPLESAVQKRGLETALARLRQQEIERRLSDLPKRAEQQARSMSTSSRGTFSAAGAALLGRAGDAIERDQLKEQKTTNTILGRIEKKVGPARFS
jgi:hypothetical protein